MKSLARLAVNRPRSIVTAWIVGVIALTAASMGLGPDFRDTFSLPGTDSDEAYTLLDTRFPAASGDHDTIALRADAHTLDEWGTELGAAVTKLEAIGSVAAVESPFNQGPGGAAQLSADARVGFLTVTYTDDAYNLPIEDIQAVAAIVEDLDAIDGLTAGHGGYPAARLDNPTVNAGELVGLAIAAIILVIAFGSGRAATVPLISAVAAVGASIATLGLITQSGPLTSSAPTLAVLLGLGIGIDYALFIVNRHRIGLKAGRDVGESIVAAMGTSGRAVIFAGTTVLIALAGMVVPRIGFLTGLAITAAVTVAFSVFASMTLVPALLALYGKGVLSRKERAMLADASAPRREAAALKQGIVTRIVERRPLLASIAAVGILAALAVPALSIRLGSADQGNDPAGSPSRVAFDLLSEGFGAGSNGAVVVVADLGAPGAFPADAQADQSLVPAPLTALAADLAADDAVASVIGPIPNATGDTAFFQITPVERPQSESVDNLVNRIRAEYAQTARDGGVEVHVGGATASNVDFTERIAQSIPVFFAIVVGLSMAVLLVAFRSVTLPLVGAALNLLSAAAAFGVVVAVFQWGWGHELIGIGSGGPIEPFVPLILFALLFGLSMDYQVFLVSRVAELWHATSDHRFAVRRGLAEVSRVIIAAASIMVVVFGSFVTSDARIMKLLGLGLAVAIALDAFLIRVVLMPALMRVLGRANWWMPAWLDRIVPHLDIDGADAEHAPTGGSKSPALTH